MKGKAVMEKGESSGRPSGRTARISRRPNVIDWSSELRVTDLVGQSSSDERYSSPEQEQRDQLSGSSVGGTTQNMVPPVNELGVQNSKPDSSCLDPLLQPLQLQQEVRWMGEFTSTLDAIRQRDDPEQIVVQYIQEPPQELAGMEPGVAMGPIVTHGDDTDEEDPVTPEGYRSYEFYVEDRQDHNLERGPNDEHPQEPQPNGEPVGEIPQDLAGEGAPFDENQVNLENEGEQEPVEGEGEEEPEEDEMEEEEDPIEEDENEEDQEDPLDDEEMGDGEVINADEIEGDEGVDGDDLEEDEEGNEDVEAESSTSTIVTS